MAKLQSIKCPSCGANVSRREKEEHLTCSYCGTSFIVDSEPVRSAPGKEASPSHVNVNNVSYQNVYVSNAPHPVPHAPLNQLKTNRGLLKTLLLSLITFGIYAIVVMSSISSDINTIAARYDGKKTMHFCLLLFLVAPITMGIGAVVWSHRISARIGNELRRRGLPYHFGAGDYWLWGVLGCFIYIGPFIYLYRLFKAMNSLCAHYNVVG